MTDALEKRSESTQRKRVLVVDDQREVADLVARILERAGFDATVLNNPLQATDVAIALRPDLIILDFDMPKLTGPEVAAQLKKTLGEANPPIIFLSGIGDDDHRAIAAYSGAAVYLEKPLDTEKLLRTIKGLI